MYLSFLAGVSPAASISALPAMHLAVAAAQPRWAHKPDLCELGHPSSATHPSCAKRVEGLRNWTVGSGDDATLRHLEGAVVDVPDLSLARVLPPLPWVLEARPFPEGSLHSPSAQVLCTRTRVRSARTPSAPTGTHARAWRPPKPHATCPPMLRSNPCTCLWAS